MNERDQVLKAAADLVSAFARNDREAYFGAFSADASFVFHTLEQPLLSRDAYQALWDSWCAEDGFEVLSCTSSNAFVSLQGDVAIFIHDVATELRRPVAGLSRTFVRYAGRAANPLAKQVTLTHDERAFMIGADHE
jgi:ketosteroid isomerase-like protein